MEQILVKPLFPQLDQFLAELKPSDTTSEFIDGRSYQKPIPQGTTIHLQTQLWDAINAVTPVSQQAIAYPNHRCSFGAWSLVPTLAVFFNPPLNPTSDLVAFTFCPHSLPDAKLTHPAFAPVHNRCPDWIIEVLTPEQNSIQALRSVIHCLHYGTQIAWLIDPDHHLVMVFWPDGIPREFKHHQVLPVPPRLKKLVLTVEQMLSWIPAKLQ